MLSYDVSGGCVQSIYVYLMSIMPRGPGPERVRPAAIEQEVAVRAADRIMTGMEGPINLRHRFECHFGSQHPVERAVESCSRNLAFGFDVYYLMARMDTGISAAGHMHPDWAKHRCERVLQLALDGTKPGLNRIAVEVGAVV